MTALAEITDDFERLLALGKAALEARDDAAAWSRSPEKQAGHHGACCDALWRELERLIQINEGGVPVLEHPARTERRIAKQIRGNITSAILEAVEATLNEEYGGAFDWEDPGSIGLEDREG